MPAVTRKGDSETGVCDLGLPDCPHTRGGTNKSTSPNVFVNNLGLHRLTDSGPCNCPHGGTYKSSSGSSSVFVWEACYTNWRYYYLYKLREVRSPY